VRSIPDGSATLGVTAAINARVLAVAALFTIGSAALVAVLPVLQSTRTNPHDALKGESRGATSARTTLRLRHGLIVSEIALAVMLLMGAGLFMRSLVNIRSVDPGFEPANVLTMRRCYVVMLRCSDVACGDVAIFHVRYSDVRCSDVQSSRALTASRGETASEPCRVSAA
jgi:hypothetical protein